MSEKEPLRPAVFLDRDGTISEEMGYVNHIDRFQIFPFAAEAIRHLNQAEIPVIVVTNQSGMARNIFPESLVHEVHKKMVAELATGGAWIDAIYFCPHRKEDACDCRKPNPGLLTRGRERTRHRLERFWVVGDRYADLEMAHTGRRARNAGDDRLRPRRIRILSHHLAEAARCAGSRSDATPCARFCIAAVLRLLAMSEPARNVFWWCG